MYIEKLKFFQAKNFSDDSKNKAILLSSCGTVTYKLFKVVYDQVGGLTFIDFVFLHYAKKSF